MAVEVVVPEMGESVLEATVASWFKEQGDRVNVGEVLVELETDKVNLEIGASHAGVLQKIKVPAGEDVRVGDVLALIDESAEEPDGRAAEQPAPQEAEAERREERSETGQVEPQVTPVARRMARDKGVDASLIPGTGPEGRVTKADVQQFLQDKQVPAQPAPLRSEEQEQGKGSAEISPARDERRIRMSRRRRTIAQRLLEAQQTTAMLTTFNEIDMEAVMDLRRRHNESFQARHGLKLGITSFFVKAAISALKAYPRLNAEIQGDEILLKYYYDIGIAIGAEEGLVVPVMRDAGRLSFAQIEQKINDFVARTNEGKLTIEDLRGGTFTITNGGVFGSLLSTPILNPPQVGILGLHKIEQRPVALNGELVIRSMMYVALSYDHRIVDGREAVQFLVHIKQLVEDPEELLLEG